MWTTYIRVTTTSRGTPQTDGCQGVAACRIPEATYERGRVAGWLCRGPPVARWGGPCRHLAGLHGACTHRNPRSFRSRRCGVPPNVAVSAGVGLVRTGLSAPCTVLSRLPQTAISAVDEGVQASRAVAYWARLSRGRRDSLQKG
jgi:hypothetical protein